MKYVKNTFRIKNIKFEFIFLSWGKKIRWTPLNILTSITHFMFDLKNICVIQKIIKIIKIIKNECFKFNFQNIYPHQLKESIFFFHYQSLILYFIHWTKCLFHELFWDCLLNIFFNKITSTSSSIIIWLFWIVYFIYCFIKLSSN